MPEASAFFILFKPFKEKNEILFQVDSPGKQAFFEGQWAKVEKPRELVCRV